MLQLIFPFLSLLLFSGFAAEATITFETIKKLEYLNTLFTTSSGNLLF